MYMYRLNYQEQFLLLLAKCVGITNIIETSECFKMLPSIFIQIINYVNHRICEELIKSAFLTLSHSLDMAHIMSSIMDG